MACWGGFGSPTAAWPVPTIWRGCARDEQTSISAIMQAYLYEGRVEDPISDAQSDLPLCLT
jgi:hypothetical protein